MTAAWICQRANEAVLWFAANPGQTVELPTIEAAREWCTANGGSGGHAVFWAVAWPFVEPRVGEAA